MRVHDELRGTSVPEGTTMMKFLEKILDGIVSVLSLIHPKEPKKKEPPRSTLMLLDSEIETILCWSNVANFERGMCDDEKELRERIVNAIQNESLREYHRTSKDF